MNFKEWFQRQELYNEMPHAFYDPSTQGVEIDLPHHGKWVIGGIDARVEDWEEHLYAQEKRKFLQMGKILSLPLKKGFLVFHPEADMKGYSDHAVGEVVTNPKDWDDYVVILGVDGNYLPKPIKYPRPGEPGYDSMAAVG